jgi:sterol 3beta-glucosyltransferase
VNITILTYGSRGDVQPFVALARGLRSAGHVVRLAAPHRFADFSAGYGIPFVPFAGDPEEISRRINDAGTNAVRVVGALREYIFGIAPQVSRAAFEACTGSDLIIHSFLFTVGAHSWAREHGVPDVSVQTFPVFAPTREFPNVAMANLPPGRLNWLSHWMATQAFWYVGNTGYRPARRANPEVPYPKRLYWPFDASRAPHLRTPMLCAFSPAVLPRPRDWAENIHLTGYLFMDDEGYQPPAVVQDFLSSGPPPICITFGSMLNRDAERILNAGMQAVLRTNHRAVFLTGWNGHRPDHNPEAMLFVESLLHSWLFPRCKMVIHHGGAGTTGAALRTGVPNIVVPHTADQPFWGRRVHVIGAGPKPIPVKRLTVENLSRAISEAGEDGIRERARAVGRRIRSEDGVAEAVRRIEAHRQRHRLAGESGTFFKV